MVYVFLAEGFEEIEALTAVDLLRRAEIDLVTVGVKGTDITGAHGITVKADINEQNLSEEIPEMIVLPGGMPGTLNLESSEIVRKMIRLCAENNRFIGAICAAPSILGHMGLLNGKKAVCYPGFEKDLIGAQVQLSSVCLDSNIVTARGAGVAIDFALELIKCLKGKDVADKIKEEILFR